MFKRVRKVNRLKKQVEFTNMIDLKKTNVEDHVEICRRKF